MKSNGSFISRCDDGGVCGGGDDRLGSWETRVFKTWLELTCGLRESIYRSFIQHTLMVRRHHRHRYPLACAHPPGLQWHQSPPTKASTLRFRFEIPAGRLTQLSCGGRVSGSCQALHWVAETTPHNLSDLQRSSKCGSARRVADSGFFGPVAFRTALTGSLLSSACSFLVLNSAGVRSRAHVRPLLL